MYQQYDSIPKKILLR